MKEKFIIHNGVLEAYNGASPVVIIPDGVLHIKTFCFEEQPIEKVILPSSVTEVSRCAFSCCSTLKEVIIPDSVTSIGEKAFWSCESLTSVTIPDSVTTIGDAVFRECDKLNPLKITTPVFSLKVFPNHFTVSEYCQYCAGKLQNHKCIRCGQEA